MLMPTLYYRNMRGLAGDLLLISDGKCILEIEFCKNKNVIDSNLPILVETEKQINQYFAGDRQIFDIPLKPNGTNFQLSVWNVLKKIPYGKTISYQELAHNVGNNNASRAVGNANGKNPIPIIIPCHRVIRKNGKLGSFGGGINIKKKLLELERNYL